MTGVCPVHMNVEVDTLHCKVSTWKFPQQKFYHDTTVSLLNRLSSWPSDAGVRMIRTADCRNDSDHKKVEPNGPAATEKGALREHALSKNLLCSGTSCSGHGCRA